MTEVLLAVLQTDEAATSTFLEKQVQNQTTKDSATATVLWQFLDDDEDGLSNNEEQIQGTSPEERDTDSDGLDDGEEVNYRKTNPLISDSDADGLSDGEEVFRGLNPLNPDSDHNVIADNTEIAPLSPSSQTVDIAATQQKNILQTETALTSTKQAAAQLTAIAAHTASATRTTSLPAQIKKSIAFIYRNDTESSSDFESFLTQQGYNVRMIRQMDILSTDFGGIKVVLVGHDTGNDSNWGDDAGSEAQSLYASGLPILGFGEGGYALFGKFGLTIGWRNGEHGELKDIRIIHPGLPYWNEPYNVVIPPTKIISLYVRPTKYVGIHYPSRLPEIEPIASTTEKPDYYPLIRQSKRYILWGFEGSPSEMTGKGQRTFVNALETLFTLSR